MLIIGSTALKDYVSGVVPKDLDIVCYKKHVPKVMQTYNAELFKETDDIIALKRPDGKFIECLVADEKPALKAYLTYERSASDVLKVASAEVLYSMKKGHVHFPLPTFEKHVRDYCALNAIFNGVDILKDITKQHYADTEARRGKLKTPSLNKTVEEFFGQSDGFVKSWFVHDDIHLAMAHKQRPMYEYMQRDASLAKCEKDLWERFTFKEKIQCVLEEAYVIALERKQIPFIFGGKGYENKVTSFKWAMKRICTTLCSGWFRKFATDNYTLIVDQMADYNYVENFLGKFERGEIRLKS